MEHKQGFLGEVIGTFLLVFFGCSSVATAVVLEAPLGIVQVSLVWGLGLMVAIAVSAPLSGAHLNPAITVAMAFWGRFSWVRVPSYVAAQFVGAFLAAIMVYAIFGHAIEAFEVREGLVRGEAGSEASAMIFGEYYPNPGGKPISEAEQGEVGLWRGALVEAFGTALLALVIFTLTRPMKQGESHLGLPGWTLPFLIGMTLCVLISLLAPVTQAGFNPARDLAPRMFSAMAGWGSLPFQVNGLGWLVVYVIAPVVGAVAGGGVVRLMRG